MRNLGKTVVAALVVGMSASASAQSFNPPIIGTTPPPVPTVVVVKPTYGNPGPAFSRADAVAMMAAARADAAKARDAAKAASAAARASGRPGR